MAVTWKSLIFAAETRMHCIMLGVNSVRKPVGEPFATQMREALLRAQIGKPNSEEVEMQRRHLAAKRQHKIVWNKV